MNTQAPSFVPSGSGDNKSKKPPAQKKRQPKKRNNDNNRDYNRALNGMNDMNLVQVAQRTGGSTDKKGRVSLNHLLSFSFPERQEEPMPTYRKSKITSYQPFNKERFINANFRFMLNATGNYIHQLADPDVNFDWDTIEQVLISSSESSSCPICLSPPSAARVTKCGHIFCSPCILHYLELRDNPKRLWRKCPICWDSIYEADLKPVRMMKPYAVRSINDNKIVAVSEGDRIDMSLIQRANYSTLAFPLSDTWPLPLNVIHNYIKPDTPLIPWHFTPSAMEFARFMLASPDYLEAEYCRDLMELKEALSDANGWGSVEEIAYIEKSRQKVNDKIKMLQHQFKDVQLAMQTWKMMFDAVAKYSKKHEKAPTFHHTQEENHEEVPEAYRQHQSSQAGEVSEQHSASIISRPIHHENTPATNFYFYQAKDGQHVYLHPLDIRILKHEFGDYDKFPQYLQVQATAIQESTLTEDLRKKCKYLGHLPLACDVTFLEINLKDIVSPDTIKVFQQELNARTKKRKDKERRDDQKRKQAETKQKWQVAKVNENERQMLKNDPFFNMYRPAMTAEESEEQLSQALSESSSMTTTIQDDDLIVPSTHHASGPRTVWGTRQVANYEEELMMNQVTDWADHIVVNKSHRKRRGKRH